MNPSEAKEVIAGYVSGLRHIPLKELNDACSVLGSAGSVTGELHEFRGALGLARRDFGLCEAFGGRAAEFADLPRVARARLFPELVKHVEECRSCRHALWEIKPLWETITTAARARCRVLTEPLRLAQSWKGSLEERGAGYPTLGATLAACAAEMTLSSPDKPATALGSRRKEWFLKDDEAECAVRVIVELSENGRATLRCLLEGEPGRLPQPDQVRIEIRRTRNNALFLAGPLSNFQADPIVLTLDAWLIKLIPNGIEPMPSWQIPLELEGDEKEVSDETTP